MHAVVVSALTFVLAYIVKFLLTLTRSTRKEQNPPGPKPKPLVGNVFDFPSPGADAAQMYIHWGKIYKSSILHASALGNHLVVLNKREDAEELLERRSAMYSNRPSSPLVPMMGWQHNIAFVPYGNEWRDLQKICQQSLGKGAARAYNPIQGRKVHEMLRALIKSPENYNDHIKLFSFSVPMAMMYGYDPHSTSDPCIEAADRSANLATKILAPGGSLIHVLPFLRHIPAWFPGAYSHRIAAEVNELTDEITRIPTELIKSRLREGAVSPSSMISDFLEKKESVGASVKEEFLMANAAYSIYLAGGDAIDSVVANIFYALAIHPEAQKKDQEEVDRVVGQSRLPDFEDRKSLPYVEAMYREVMRWQPPSPIGVPHTCPEDDYYKGYFIPKGTAVLGNIWAMTHDEAVYPDPNAFNPERFLDEKGQLNGDDKVWAYGFGRRICAGSVVGSSTAWLVLVSILAVFDIGKAKDESGNDIEINDEYEVYGLVQHKKHFPCSIIPRSPYAVALATDKGNH